MTLVCRKWNCEFEPIPTWSTDIPFMCRFSFAAVAGGDDADDWWRREGSNLDWIGGEWSFALCMCIVSTLG